MTNYKGVAHPSQPNVSVPSADSAFPSHSQNAHVLTIIFQKYIAAVAGSTHNVNSGRKNIIKGFAPTIVDLLKPAGISWGLYQEDLPYSGFQGDYFNPVNERYDYVRKHK